MVYQKHETTEGQDGEVKESIVLSRIRMLENSDGRKPIGNPEASTRKNVHPFNRFHNSIEERQQNETQHQQPTISDESEKRDSDDSIRKYQDVVAARQMSPAKNTRQPPVISTDESHLAQIRKSSPRNDGGSPLRRDDTVHPFAVDSRKDFSMYRQKSISPRARIPVGLVANKKASFNETPNKTLKSPSLEESAPAATPPINNRENSSVEKSKLPSRVAAHFSPKDSALKKREDFPVKNSVTEIRAVSPADDRLTMQRHVWNKRLQGSTDSNSIGENKNEAKEASEVKVSILNSMKEASKKAKDPSPINAHRPLSKPEPEPGISFKQRSPKSKVIMAQVRRKHPLSPSSRNSTKESSSEQTNLERNLHAAAVVLNEEKLSNVGSSSSSSRSALSQAELGGIAAKALQLSQVQAKTKLEKSPLRHIVTADRVKNKSSKDDSLMKSNSQSSNSFAYSSAQRLSERFTRAERFSALKKARNAAQKGPQYRDLPPSPLTQENSTHPVFGYTKSNVYVNVAATEDTSIASPQPSCVRRSKHLSQALQNKANQFALASPSRRQNNNTSGSKTIADSRNVQHQQRYHDQLFVSQQEPMKTRGYDPLGLQNALRTNSGMKGEKYLHSGGPKGKMDPLPSSTYKYPSSGNGSARIEASKNMVQQPMVGSRNADYTLGSGKQKFEPNPAGKNVKNAPDRHQGFEPQDRKQQTNLRKDEFRYRIEQHDSGTPSESEFDQGNSGSFEAVSSTDGEMFYEVSDHEMISKQSANFHMHSNTTRTEKFSVYGDVSSSPRNRSTLYDSSSQYYNTNSLHVRQSQSSNEVLKPGCDNTYTGSLNKFYENETPRTFSNNTYTGSLNKPIVLKDSSDSSAARPDAFHWLHRKYGNKAPVVTDVAKHGIRGASVEQRRPSPEKKKYAVENGQIGNDEDDVFFGLDEANSVDEQQKAVYPSNAESSLQIESNNFYVRNYAPNKDENKESNRGLKRSAEKIVGRDVTASLNVEKELELKHRPNPVETVADESCGSPCNENDDMDETFEEDEELGQDENKPPASSVLKNLGSVIVQSIQRACAIPVKYVEELPDLAGCAMTTKMKCEEKISEAWVGLGDEEDTAKHSGSVNETSETTDRGDSVVRDEPTQNGEKSQITDVSSESPTNEQQMKRRNEAQIQLLHHAGKAMSFFGTKNIDKNVTSSTDSSSPHGPKPLTNELSPTSKASETTLNADQRMVLQTFSTSLKSGGIEVLKLSRWNKWQVRYLTVSREVIQLGISNETSGNTFPKALLWPKHIARSPQSRSVTNLKENGRGGVLFENLNHVIPIESNEYYDRNLPKRLKNKFPEFAGVLVDCRFPAGDRHVHICFKTKQDAQSFITTMLIIKGVGNRQAATEINKEEPSQAQITSYPTASVETKSVDS